MYHNVLAQFGQVIRESIGIDAEEFAKKTKQVSNPIDDLPTPEQVKEFLLDTFNMKDWKTFIDSQLYGGCQELAELIVAKFPAIKIIQGDGELSKKAAKKLNATSVAAKMFTHYFNKIDNTESSDTVKLNATQTLTNKTIDADDNTISDLTTSNLKSGVLQTTVRAVASASDTAIPSEKAVASALAAKSYNAQNTALTASGGVCTWTVTHNLNNSNVGVFLYEVSSGDRVMYDYAITSANVVTIKILSSANIAANTYKVVVLG